MASRRKPRPRRRGAVGDVTCRALLLCGLDLTDHWILVEGSIVLTLVMKTETLQPMPLRYREDRATQAAARLLRLRGGTMSYLKLVKLLYFADRLALVEPVSPSIYDMYVSIAPGSVLRETVDLFTE